MLKRKVILKIKAALKAAFLYVMLLNFSACSETDNQHPFNNTSNNKEQYSFEPSSNNTSSPKESSEPQIQLLFSKKFEYEKTIYQSSFDCDQKIFAVLLLKNYPNQLHNIVVNWLDPYNKQRESTEIPTFISKDQVYTWSSLSLHRDVTAGMLQWINPAAGMEEFIGEWQVKVLIENELVQSEKFTVVC